MIFWRIWWVAYLVTLVSIAVAMAVWGMFRLRTAEELEVSAAHARNTGEQAAILRADELERQAAMARNQGLARMFWPFLYILLQGPVLWFSGAYVWGW